MQIWGGLRERMDDQSGYVMSDWLVSEAGDQTTAAAAATVAVLAVYTNMKRAAFDKAHCHNGVARWTGAALSVCALSALSLSYSLAHRPPIRTR